MANCVLARLTRSLIVILLLSTLAGANELTNPRLLADNAKAPATARSSDPTEEKNALELVETFLPELSDVLTRLRADHPSEYQRAIRDLNRSARKLELAKKRDERLFEIEVELLKAQNVVNLLTAKLKVRDSQTDRNRLREAVARLQSSQLVRSEYEVEMLRQRIEKSKRQLEAAEKRLDAKRTATDDQLEKTYLGLLKKAGRQP